MTRSTLIAIIGFVVFVSLAFFVGRRSVRVPETNSVEDYVRREVKAAETRMSERFNLIDSRISLAEQTLSNLDKLDSAEVHNHNSYVTNTTEILSAPAPVRSKLYESRARIFWLDFQSGHIATE